jgi:hypothetical protein
MSQECGDPMDMVMRKNPVYYVWSDLWGNLWRTVNTHPMSISMDTIYTQTHQKVWDSVGVSIVTSVKGSIPTVGVDTSVLGVGNG